MNTTDTGALDLAAVRERIAEQAHELSQVHEDNQRLTRERDEARAEALRWAADHFDPGPVAKWETPRSETQDAALCARRDIAVRLRRWADASPAEIAAS